MNKIEAIAQVVQMTKLAESTIHEGEAETARAQVLKMRLRHGISDADLAATVSESESEDFVFFGHKMFFYSREIEPIVREIQVLIDRACAKLDTEDARNRMEGYCKLFNELRWLIDAKTSDQHRPNIWERVSADATNAKAIYDQIRAFKRLQQRRDDAVRAFYHEEYKSHAALGNEGRPDNERPRSWDHRWARDITAMHSDLRKPQVESIVGVTEDDLLRQEQAEYEAREREEGLQDA